MSEFEWDERKEAQNIQKHGIDFDTASQIWNHAAFEKLDSRRDYGEERFITLGVVQGRVLVVVYTWRGKFRRLISARRATSREQQSYEEAIQKSADEASD